jgi:hypothetical protein
VQLARGGRETAEPRNPNEGIDVEQRVNCDLAPWRSAPSFGRNSATNLRAAQTLRRRREATTFRSGNGIRFFKRES